MWQILHHITCQAIMIKHMNTRIYVLLFMMGALIQYQDVILPV